MPISAEATILYQYLRSHVIPGRKVVTYGEVEKATGIPIGVEGGYMGKRLGEIATACDERGLPPISAIVVRANEPYDPTRRHGMPGPGYFVQEATSPNHAQRDGHDLFVRWGLSPAPAGFDKDADRWSLKFTIEAHQDSVWRRKQWPVAL